MSLSWATIDESILATPYQPIDIKNPNYSSYYSDIAPDPNSNKIDIIASNDHGNSPIFFLEKSNSGSMSTDKIVDLKALDKDNNIHYDDLNRNIDLHNIKKQKEVKICSDDDLSYNFKENIANRDILPPPKVIVNDSLTGASSVNKSVPSPIPSPISTPLASPLPSPISSPISTPLTSPISSPISSPKASTKINQLKDRGTTKPTPVIPLVNNGDLLSRKRNSVLGKVETFSNSKFTSKYASIDEANSSLVSMACKPKNIDKNLNWNIILYIYLFVLILMSFKY